MLSKCGERLRIDAERTTDGATALYIACQRGYTTVVARLLDAGADCNRQRKGGFSPVWTACQRGHMAIVELLIAQATTRRKSQFGELLVKPNFVVTSHSGVSPANAAQRAGHNELARIISNIAYQQQREDDKLNNSRQEIEARVQEAESTNLEDFEKEVPRDGQILLNESPETSSFDAETGNESSIWPKQTYASGVDMSWSWERYIKQKAHFTHDLCSCVRRNTRSSFTHTSSNNVSRKDNVVQCSWWRLRPGSDIERCQISQQLLKQILDLHDYAIHPCGTKPWNEIHVDSTKLPLLLRCHHVLLLTDQHIDRDQAHIPIQALREIALCC